MPPPGAVLVIGDSHASFATGLHGLAPLFPAPAPAALHGLRAARLGPFLAHSLTTPRHPVRRLIRAAARSAAPHDPILLCFGEIDCRCHLVPIAQRSRRTIERVAADTALAYARSAAALLPKRPLAFLAATPTPAAPVPNPDFPTRGTLPQRRRATRAFNRALRRAAAGLGAAFIDLGPDVADARGNHRPRFFQDEIHLGPGALPLLAERLIALRWTADPAALRAAARALARIPAPPNSAAPTTTAEPDVDALLDRAALECRAKGARRIALIGAGRHTRRIGLTPFTRRGLRVVALLDDAPQRRRLLGLPVRSLESPGANFDAVVVSSDAHEDALAARARRSLPSSVHIVRIYRWAA